MAAQSISTAQTAGTMKAGRYGAMGGSGSAARVAKYGLAGLVGFVAGCLLMIAPVLYFGLHWPGDIGVSLVLAAVAGWWSARRRPWLVRAARRLDFLLERRPMGSSRW